MKREDNSLLVVTHLMQLIDLILWPVGIIVALILWQTKKDEVLHMDAHGKSILNFQISMLLWFLICIPLCLVLVGFLGLFVLFIIALIFPITNAIRASNGQEPYYPLTINIIK